MPDNDDVITDIAVMIRKIRRDDNLIIDRDTEIGSLGIDSLDFVELMFSIEEKYNVDIEFNANTDGVFPFATVGSAADAVQAMVVQKLAVA